MDRDKYLYTPISLLLVTLSENHEQISFAYPFQPTRPIARDNSVQLESLRRLESVSPERKRRTEEIHQLKPEILAHLLSVKGATDLPFELKIDNLRYAGFPKLVTDPRGRSPRIFNVVFVLNANMPADLVTSYEELSQKIAIAVDSEQTRCNYLHTEMSVMLDAHDTAERTEGYNSNNPGNAEADCFHEILSKSSLANDLCNIFNDLADHGLVYVFLNNVVEIGYCLIERCMIRAGLAPKTSVQIEAQVPWIRPYHGILLLDDAVPGPDASSDMPRIKPFCTPDHSILEICRLSGLATMQVFLIVRHLLTWARAMPIYPVCLENVYSSSAYPQLQLTNYSAKFKEYFNKDLATVLVQFSPPRTLEQFMDPTVHSEDEQMLRYNIVLFLLRYNLIVQLHTFVYIMEPFSDHQCDKDALATLENEELRKMIEKTSLSACLKAHVASISNALLKAMPSAQVVRNLSLFIQMIPFLNGEHHIEDIMFRLKERRLVISRILDLFVDVLCSFQRPDFIHNQFP